MPITLDPKSPEHPVASESAKAKAAEAAAPAVVEKRRSGRPDRYTKDRGLAPSHDPDLGKKKPPRGRASGLRQIDRALVQANAGGVRAPINTAPPVPPKPDAATRATADASKPVDVKTPPPLPPRPGQAADARTPPPLPPRPGQAAAAAPKPPPRSGAQQLFGKVLDGVASDYLAQSADRVLQEVRATAPSVGVSPQLDGGLHKEKVTQHGIPGLGTHRNVTDVELGRYQLGSNARLGLGGAELGQNASVSANAIVGTRGTLQHGDHELSYGLRGGQHAEASHSAQASAGVDGVKAAMAESATLGPRQRGELGYQGKHLAAQVGSEVYTQAHVEQSHGAQVGPLGASASLGGAARFEDGMSADAALATEAGVAHGRVKAELQGSLSDRGQARVGLGGVHALHDMHAGASAGATADADFTSRGVRVGGETLDLRGQGQVSAKLLAEADVHLAGSATIQPPRACVDVEGKAFAGVKAEATGQVGLGQFVTVHGNADVRAGIGAQGVCRVGYDEGKLRFKLGGGWGSGVGAGAGVGVDVDVVRIGKAGTKLGLQAASAPVRYLLDPQAMVRDRQQLVDGLKTVAGFPQGIAKMSTDIAGGVGKKVLGGHLSDEAGTGAPARAGSSAAPVAAHTRASHDVQGVLSKNLLHPHRDLPMVSKREVQEEHSVGKARTAASLPSPVRKVVELLKD